jgi:dCMP deaminase
MKEKMVKAYMKTAEVFSELSHAQRRHVGAIIVKDDRIISIGYNGMPAGWDNNCEDKEYMSGDAGGWLDPEEIYERWPFEETVVVANDNESFETTRRYRLKTKPEVLHAETNAIAKLARSTESGLGADLFVTLSPCLDCAKLIYQSGITRVWFSEHYRDNAGIDFLKASGVEVEKFDLNNKESV